MTSKYINGLCIIGCVATSAANAQNIVLDTTIVHPKRVETVVKTDTIGDRVVSYPLTTTYISTTRKITYAPEYINMHKPISLAKRDSIITKDADFLDFLGEYAITQGTLEQKYTMRNGDAFPFEFSLPGPDNQIIKVFDNNFNGTFDAGDIIKMVPEGFLSLEKQDSGYVVRDSHRDQGLQRYQTRMPQIKQMYVMPKESPYIKRLKEATKRVEAKEFILPDVKEAYKK